MKITASVKSLQNFRQILMSEISIKKFVFGPENVKKRKKREKNPVKVRNKLKNELQRKKHSDLS